MLAISVCFLRQLFIIAVSITFLVGASVSYAYPDGREHLAVEDYFKIKRVTELALSSDGKMLVYVVSFQSIKENRLVRTVYVSSTGLDATPVALDEIQNGRSFSWVPETHRLAFLSSDGNATQVYSIDIETKSIYQHTNGKSSIITYGFAPNGINLAWLAADSDDAPVVSGFGFKKSSLYEQLYNGQEGVVIDTETTFAANFVNPNWPDVAVRAEYTLWIKNEDSEPVVIKTPGQARDFHWSSDASHLSILYVSDNTPKGVFFDKHTSIGVLDIATKSFRSLALARPPAEEQEARYYFGGEWVPDANKLIVRRTTERNRWQGRTEWNIFDVSKRRVKSGEWNKIEIYPRASDFLPVSEDIIFSNHIVRARQSLYLISPLGIEQSKLFGDVTGTISMVRFSADFKSAVFINESHTDPQEIHFWRQGAGLRRVSNLNDEVARKQMPDVEEVLWQSADGGTVQGWVLLPPVDQRHEKPWPLITFVHGGPSLPMPDEFAFYFKAYGGIWPYTFNLYALNGMAVFIPNYRGTQSFGDEFAHPPNLDGVAIDDIITGIEYLVREGVADPERLAISGHSHGAWLGPMVMTRARYFKAASFAEGNMNKIINYSLGAEYQNRDIHDVQHGASLYDNPGRYIELSPSLHLEGLSTAILFEAGVKSAAIKMMADPKAAQRAGLPAEFIVYPQTGHNIRLPKLIKESAQRNLDWFRFWLLAEEDDDVEKSTQYERWRELGAASEKDS